MTQRELPKTAKERRAFALRVAADLNIRAEFVLDWANKYYEFIEDGTVEKSK